jgi:hypothetical protein
MSTESLEAQHNDGVFQTERPVPGIIGGTSRYETQADVLQGPATYRVRS